MAKFLSGSKLNAELENIFENANKELIVISPFIKLHARFIEILKRKAKEDRLKMKFVFGKNEGELKKSFSIEQFEIVNEFPNIEIYYEPRLHAKYYANDEASILSSMNLYDFSVNNNIEFGILTGTSLITIGENVDSEANKYFNQVIDGATLLFKNTPIYESKLGGIKKVYSGFETVVDDLTQELTPEKRKKTSIAHMGFCIYSGQKINFNLEKPLAYEVYKKLKNEPPSTKMNYCHFSGEPSKGETTIERPILRKNWKKASKYSEKSTPF